jgi:hypothetical protein
MWTGCQNYLENLLKSKDFLTLGPEILLLIHWSEPRTSVSLRTPRPHPAAIILIMGQALNQLEIQCQLTKVGTMKAEIPPRSLDIVGG